MRSKSFLIVLCLFLFVLHPTFAQDTVNDPVTVIDAFGEEITIDDTSRIVTIGGSVTEVVFALGAGENVIARDDSSLYPLAVNDLESVGYVRTLSAEPVLSLEPTLIITNEDAGPPESIEQLQAAGVTMLIVPTDDSIEGVISMIETVAQALHLEDVGDELVTTIENDYSRAQSLLTIIESSPRVMFIYARGAGAVSVAGANTSADTMITLAGAENAVTEFEGFQPITAEAVVTAAPDIILMMTRGLDSLGGIEGTLEQPGIAQTPAGETSRIIAVDDLYLLGFSTRVGTAVLDLTYLLHDELDPPLTTILRADGRFSTLLSAVDAIGQMPLLDSPGSITIFAPTDDAFSALAPGMLDGLMSSVISLQVVLSYHVINDTLLAEDLVALDGETVQPVYPDALLSISVTADGVILNDAVTVIETDHAANGIIHVIDTVLVPERP